MSKIGQISQVSNCEEKHQVELTWKIEDIFAYTVEDVYYESPHFSVQDSEWFLSVYPNGETEQNSVGWISVYLMRHGDETSPKCAIYSFGVKKACGAVEQMGEYTSWLFGEDGVGYGRRFLERSKLLRRKSELTSSGGLTLTCSLSLMDDTFGSTTFTMDTLSKNFAELFLSKRGCDVTLKMQHREFLAHKLVLSARSTVFAAMLEAEMKEKETGVVEIVDCDPEAFQDFLTFLYSAKLQKDTNFNKVIELYKIADKYSVLELRSVCSLYMMSHLTVENVCDVVALGNEFGDESLQDKTKYFFNDNFGKIIRTTSWKSLLKSNSRLVNELLINMATEKNL